jgi:uncharacterized protein
MLGCIWSCPADQMLRFPVATLIRFCHNHGLIQVEGRPAWWTVSGGSRSYVKRIIEGIVDARLNTPVTQIVRQPGGVKVLTALGAERFDAVVLAVHSDQALRLLEQPLPAERAILSSIRFQANRAVLHTDVSVMPRSRRAWAAWNYQRAADQGVESSSVCLHYWLNRLQPLPFAQPVLVSLNLSTEIDPSMTLGEYRYDHPIFDLAAIRAQQRLESIQGTQQTWFCGAWTGYGFHEDGFKSGLAAAEQILQQMRFRTAA